MAMPAPQPPPPPAAVAEASGADCANCGSPVVRRYCADCGQAAPAPDDYSLGAHASELVDQVASVDGRIARTLWTLVRRPGALTAEHLRGRRARYLRPLQLFLIVNVLLFVAAPRMPLFNYSLRNYLRYAPPSPTLVSSMVRRVTASDPPVYAGVPIAEYAASFDGRVEAQRKSLILLFVPALALVLRAMFARRAPRDGAPHRYGEHLVFALHLLAFVWLVLAGWGALAALNQSLGGVRGVGTAAMLAAVVALAAGTPAYTATALRRVYGLSWPLALGATAALGLAFTALLVLYRSLLFFTTYWTL